jgi:Gpi18-like mannosyltransferase
MERSGSVPAEMNQTERAARLSARRRRQSIQYPLALFFFTTVFTFFFGVCAFLVLENKMPPEGWLGIWNRWDAPDFLDLAQNGYPHQADAREFLLVLLPLYPLTIRLTHWIVRDWQTAALLVSNICCAGAFVYFFLLNRLEYGDGAARRALFFLAIFPTAYFLHVGYAESLFLLLSIAAFYHARRGQWLLCGLLGMLATGTRIPGIALLPPLAFEYLQQKNFRWRQIRWNVVSLVFLPLGAVIYIYICYRNYGSAFHFLDLQRKIWGVFLRWPFPSVVGNWQGVWHAKASERVLQYGGPFVAFVLATAALVIAPFRLRACYAIYLGVSWVLIFSNNYPVCSPRYLLAVFPFFMLLAQLCRCAWIRDSVAFVCLLFYALCTTSFIRGWWAF